MKNIMKALKKQNMGLAVVTTKKDYKGRTSVYKKFFQFWKIEKADEFYMKQVALQKSGDISGVRVEVGKVLF